MRGHDLGIAYRREESSPYVEIWKQPFLRWLIAKLYHEYEWFTEPLWRRVSTWHQKNFGESLEYIPLVNRRDIRCDRLKFRKRICLAVIYVTMDQYDIIRGKKPVSDKPRHEIKDPIPAPEEASWPQAEGPAEPNTQSAARWTSETSAG